MRRNPKLKLILSSALVAGLLFAGCGTDKQESVSVNLETFTSPDGNIGCIADKTMVRCDIKHKEWKVKRDPKCPLDYGNGVTVADRKAELVCAGDTTINNGPDVAPGMVNMVGPFECTTSEFGDSMHCENMNTGNGFELSTEGYKLF